MNPKFIAGPPGTGKTHDFILKKYSELFEKYNYDKIVVLSHTNVAADQIREAIANLKIVKDKNINDSDLEDYICTIHSYCKNKLVKKDVFDYEDHNNLCRINSSFNKIKVNKYDDLSRDHGFYKFLNDAHGQGYYHDLRGFYMRRDTDRSSYNPYGIRTIEELKAIYEKYKQDNSLFDFMDMIQEFIHKAKAPDIDALIVDEAQDSNKPQIKALEKMAANVKDGHYYMIGDADQTIFEFAGSDPEYFHTLSKNTTEELEEGKRCGKTINSLCKKIIDPIWKHYGYTRKWLPAVYTDRHLKENKIVKGFKVGDVIKGNKYYLPDLKASGALEKLLDKIKNTNQTFLFTYRQTPGDRRIIDFFKDKAIQFEHVKGSTEVSKKELSCHQEWPKFIKGQLMSLKQIKSFWDYIGSKAIMKGKSKNKKPFENWINKDYSVDYLILNGLLNSNIKEYESFDQVRVKVDKEKLIYINKLIKNFNSNKEVRVKYGNIHDVKGLTFDNVIVDESLYRDDEPYFVQLRLKYTAYSRGIFDCWTLCSETGKRLGVKNGRI